ncbi:MAG: hypothetical protein A3I77_03725 [Gammaproteobacteria bacterium RIFCSPLOWO2_02_FULL_42_14]|nr:MAG: hypothetical protein A3B71_05030 [Gammaproteobacteria bacterium RIFCSPHIGHO2_02_FULL_42_43]OGT28917.1 MAG: hypothetical protein A2624_02355 [Gammaproteobacteria bacterium RIFCSPHIGHO2_01_FULL_42_8]OGT51367.1 MAG: hypothetical protein A3E54_04795 [Gammaproteobacteria bacterium RIFCSPHIGHO2_12_FULL_41_25]OGT62069.1 MAG: hypothetical protein A3I77_03725 [Gammaproteobacteria bacterium RIFCSPLOWO2_02_FULL_42_14]OGT85741.1 MAG: hypothetical protein A3G86_03420 [Gammaproteobacteria bacterium R
MKLFIEHCYFLLDSKAKKQLPFLLLIFFSSSCLDVVGIGLVGVFLLWVVNFDHMQHMLPAYIQSILNHFSRNEFFFFIGAILIFSFLVKAFWAIHSQKKMVYFVSQFSLRLKMRLMINYQNAAYSFHLKENSAYMINKVSMVDSFSNSTLSTLLSAASYSFITLSVMVCLLIANWVVTLFLIVMVSALFFLYELLIKKNIAKTGKIMATFGGEINKSVFQALGGLKEIRVLGKEVYFLNKIKTVSGDYLKAVADFNVFQLTPRYAVESGASIFLVSLVLGALLIGTNPVNMIPTLGIFATACMRLLPTISGLMSQLGQLRSSGYVTGMLYDELSTLENQSKINLDNAEVCPPHAFSQFSLSNAAYCYPNAKNKALNNINLSLLRGQSVGLIGSSGAGKSTLVSVLLGLLTPDSGQLLVDEHPVKNLRSWLNNFAYIPQSIFLLDDTLKRNIAMGIVDSEIDDCKLKNAIEMAQLTEVVSELPHGVDTRIGENGVLLSGGQRQRVAIARAFYHEREIIIMDEATSSLDNETEREVINSIKKLHGIKTLIVIAHRLSTIQYCDVVYKLEKGKIIAHGHFDEVVSASVGGDK